MKGQGIEGVSGLLEKAGKYRRNALHYASAGGHVGVMKYFIERGYNPASESTEGLTCLHVAALYNHYDLVQYLVDEQKMDPMCQTKLGNTPLHSACDGIQWDPAFRTPLKCGHPR